MAWNQPGGQNNPWGRRPGQGNQDLDEKVRNWQRRLESLLKGRGGGAEGGGDGGNNFFILAVILFGLGAWLFTGFFQIKAAERGVIQRFGKLVDVRHEGWGWHWPWPIETLSKVNVASINSRDFQSRVLTADVNLVDMRFAVQYRFADPIKYLFRVRDPEGTLREVSESAIREVVGQSTLDAVLFGATRPQITQRTKDLIQRTLDAYNTGIEVTTVNLTDLQVPEAVIPSQRDANKALADQERSIREAQAYANGIIPVARGDAAKIQQEAEAYRAQVVAIATGQAARFEQLAQAYARAPEVTRQRLYLDAIENVLSRANKVVVDSRPGGAGNVLYLPLDKLLERRNVTTTTGSQAEMQQRLEGQEIESVTVDGRSRGAR